MPSPFPGMDPYLEGDLWQEFHETLASAIRAQLMPRLTPKYVALLAKRYVIDSPVLGLFDIAPRVFYPDVHVVEAPEADGGAVAVAAPPIAIAAPEEELPSVMRLPQLAIEIRDVAARRLVTVIEILSPANKQGEGAREYHERRLDLLEHTDVHLLEIDLLRGGSRIQLYGTPRPAPYYVYLSRVSRRPNTQIWRIQLRQRLPTVPVPLLHPDPDVALDLQAAVDACFALVGYERLLDYSAPLPPPELPEPEAAWVRATLEAARAPAT